MMKRCLFLLSVICVIFAITPAFSAFAADDGDKTPPSNVTITVVLPEFAQDSSEAAAPVPETSPEPTPEPVKMYPVDVTETVEGAFRQIVKTYELNENETPDDIPRANFERSGYMYTLTDILRKETASTDTREHTETVTLNTDTKDIEKIIPLLAQTMEFKTADGYLGILELDVASIKVETAGTKTTSYTTSVTREYPHLSANDTELVPKTVTDKGKTYNLAGVEWKVGNYSTVDYERIADYYTAIATYTATGSSTKVTGYVTTAEYKGTLAKLIQGKPVYAAYFLGTEIRTPLEMTEPPTTEKPDKPCVSAEPTTSAEPTDEETTEPTTEPTETEVVSQSDSDGGDPETPIGWIIMTALLASGCGIMYYFLRKARKESKSI
jgi:hypothetical protein